MDFSKSNLKPYNLTNNKVSYTENRVWLWLKKFWEFSLFYGDYLASLHSQKK